MPELGEQHSGLSRSCSPVGPGFRNLSLPHLPGVAWDPFLTETSNQQGWHKHTLFVYTPVPHPKLPAPLKPEITQLGLLFSHPSRRL